MSEQGLAVEIERRKAQAYQTYVRYGRLHPNTERAVQLVREAEEMLAKAEADR